MLEGFRALAHTDMHAHTHTHTHKHNLFWIVHGPQQHEYCMSACEYEFLMCMYTCVYTHIMHTDLH